LTELATHPALGKERIVEIRVPPESLVVFLLYITEDNLLTFELKD
jgi:hypothetical protein